MGILKFRCPVDGHAIDVGIDTEARSLRVIRSFRVRAWCTVCKETHEWRGEEGWIDESRAA